MAAAAAVPEEPPKSQAQVWAEGFIASYKAALASGKPEAVAALYSDDGIISMDGDNQAGKAALVAKWAAVMSGKAIYCKDAAIAGIMVDLGGGVKTIAVSYTAEWVPAGVGAEHAQRFGCVFTLMPSATGGTPLVKNHIQRRTAPDGIAPNVPATHAAVQDFVGKFYAAQGPTVTGKAKAAALGGVYSDAAAMHYEGLDVMGKAAILSQLEALPPAKLEPRTVDVHPVTPTSSVAYVTGVVTLEEHPLAFTQAVFVVAAPAGSAVPMVIAGDLYQLNYG